MIILNTTFHIARPDIEEVVTWIRNSYIPAALHAGLSSPMLTRIIGSVADGCESYALHLQAPDLALAEKWNTGVGASLRAILGKRYGERALTFFTYLEILE